MAVFMFALLGFPIFGGLGFLAKWFMLKAALQAPAPQTRLAVAIVLTSVVSAGYYLYVVMVMFMRPRNAGAAPLLPVRRLSGAVIAVAAAILLLFGIYPNPIVRWTQASGLLTPSVGTIRTTAAPIQR
jgi:NADH-quinone oxidoreductase subunit N